MRSFKGAIRFSLRTGTSETKARRGGEGGKKKGNFRNPAGALGPLRLYGGRAGGAMVERLRARREKNEKQKTAGA